ncbi:hypothetical protein DFH09DRAFT_332511 [Mycena vulgaris]|nr:hypothetical protein DFH09DRAFT_332511 [Mycena vulgaris]
MGFLLDIICVPATSWPILNIYRHKIYQFVASEVLCVATLLQGSDIRCLAQFFSCLPPLPAMNSHLATHPCYQNSQPKSKLKPDTTVTLKYIKTRPDRLPANYPYLTPAVEGLYANKGMYEHLPIPYFEFRGLSAPPSDVGTPGDVYISTSPDACALYSKSEEDWSRWAGPASDETLTHPHFVDSRNMRYIWFHPKDGVEWISLVSVRRRQVALRDDGFMTSEKYSEQAGWDLASRIISDYLAGGKPKPVSPPASSPRRRGVPIPNELEIDDSDSNSDVESVSDAAAFYPSKKARQLDSVSTGLPASRSRVTSRGDPEMVRLRKEQAALQSRRDQLRQRQRELVPLVADQKAQRDRGIIQKLEKEYDKYMLLPTLTGKHSPSRPERVLTASLEAEFSEKILDLRCRLAIAKTTLQAKELQRSKIESETAERRRICDDRRKRQEQIRALCGA